MEVAKPVSPFTSDATMDEKQSPVESQQTTQAIITFNSNDPENPYNWSKVGFRASEPWI
jgi:hypothetical protein